MVRRFPLALLAVSLCSLAEACMGVGDEPVRFAGQTNIVVWDRLRGQEYFVRDARFETRGKSLGFIAPTPTRPALSSVDDSAFSLLASLGPRSFGYAGGGGGFGGAGGLGGGVAVVQRQVVSGYEATVLKADDSDALVLWLRANGYAVPAYAGRWAQPYVRRKWFFTAFKVAAGDGAAATGPVCMSFRTPMPINPYSVPAENQAKGGLSLYYVSNGDEKPLVGGVQPWLAPQWSKAMTDENVAQLEKSLKTASGVLPKNATVRFYRDEGFGRPGLDDLYFVPAPTKRDEHDQRDGSSLLLSGLGLCALACVRVGRRR